MSLTYIPFQPVFFGDLPEDCCPRDSRVCGVGDAYANLVQYNDYTSFQLLLDSCDEATQVLDNPNFANSESVQLLSNPDFSDGLTDWSFVNGDGEVIDGVLEFTEASCLLVQGTTFTTSQVLVEIEILENDGTITISADGTNPSTTETGTFTAIITPFTPNLISIGCTGNTASKITAVRVYSLPDIQDWNSQDPAIVQNGIVTISGNGSISQQSTLSANTTYLFRVNVVDLIGEAVFITTSAETFPITSVGVHEFVMTTGATPVVSIYASNQQASIQFVEAYEWFTSTDFTLNIRECGSEVDLVEVTDAAIIETDRVTFSFSWGDILVDDEALPEGCYYLHLESSCGDTMESQPFRLAESHACSQKITACMDNDAFGFVFDNFTPSVRLTTEYVEAEWQNERNRFTDTAQRSVTYWGKVEEIITVGTVDVPRYIQRFLGLLPIFNNVFLGTQNYTVNNETMNVEANPEFPTWGRFDIEFKLNNYPLTMTKCDDTTKDCAPPPNCWLWPDGQELLWEDDLENECILYN